MKIKDYFENNNIQKLIHDSINIVNDNLQNFSTINIKQYRQKMFKNKSDKNRGICGLVSIYSAFNDYLNDVNIEQLTKLPTTIRNNANNLVDYFNENHLIKGYHLHLSEQIPNYMVLKKLIESNINNGYSLVICFTDSYLFDKNITLNEDKSKLSKIIGHAIAIYLINDNYIGFVENSFSKSVTIDILSLFWLSYFNYIGNENFDFPNNITLNELYTNKQYKKYFDLFRESYVRQKSINKFEIDIRMLFVPKLFSNIRTLQVITLTKIRKENM